MVFLIKSLKELERNTLSTEDRVEIINRILFNLKVDQNYLLRFEGILETNQDFE